MTVLPWHDAPQCPRCGAHVVTPMKFAERYSPDHLFCPACGIDWRELNLARIAQAWGSAGAWRGRQLTLQEREAARSQFYCREHGEAWSIDEDGANSGCPGCEREVADCGRAQG